MSLYDVVSDIGSKEEVLYGPVLGVVAENYKKELPGMVQVSIPTRDEESSIYRWAKVAQMYSGKSWGQYFLPEIGDQVLIAFEHGNMERPFIIGSVPRDNDKFISQSSKEKNEIKRIVTRQGNEIALEDRGSDDGSKDRIQIHTSNNGQSISMDNEKNQIVIKAQEKLTIKVGDSITVTMNGNNGAVSIDAKKVTISASAGMEYKTDGSAKFSGSQTVIEASSVLKANSNGMVNIQGSMIKIG